MSKEDKRKTEGIRYNRDIEQIVDNLTLFDDDLMSMVFDENIPATELLLKIILKRDDIEVISVTAQKELENPIVDGRNIKLDILARGKNDRYYNVEVQRSNAGADERRARFHSSMIDSRMLKKGQNFKELKDSYVVFITQKDYFGYGLPVYTVNRHLEERKVRFKDGSHIIYVNGSYRGSDPIGKLMEDFACKNADDMYYSELADGVRHFKEEGGRKFMCQAVEEYAAKVAAKVAVKAKAEVNKAKAEAARAAVKATIEDAVSYGMSKEQIVEKVCDKYGINEKKAKILYNTYAAITST